MVSVTRQLGRINSSIGNLQSRIAKSQDNYKYALLSGEGSLPMLRDQQSRFLAALGMERVNYQQWVQEAQQEKEAMKALNDLGKA